MKEAQEQVPVPEEPVHKFHPTPPKHHKPRLNAYPNYNKALISQRHKSPAMTGLSRGLQTGLTGAVLGALITRMASDQPKTVGTGAAIGGLLGGAAGASSGIHEAHSDNSKMLFLRRRMGVNEPGELDALLQNPELLDELTQKQGALSPTATKALLTAAAAGGGYALGTQGTSRIIGYHDDPQARHVGGYVNAANAAGLTMAALTKNPVFRRKILNPGILGGMASLEVVPAALRSANRMSASSQAQADSQLGPTLARFLNTPVARGAAVGTGLAGLAAIVSGLRRAKTEEEIRKNRSRYAMMGQDFLKYLVPAAVGGGVVGSMSRGQQS